METASTNAENSSCCLFFSAPAISANFKKRRKIEEERDREGERERKKEREREDRQPVEDREKERRRCENKN